MSDPRDRRRYLRLDAPVFCRPAGKPFFGRRRAVDIGMGGIRLYADETQQPGDRLALELLLPDESEITCKVEVVWVEELPEGSPARFDVGVKFVEISAADGARLSSALVPLSEPP